MANPTNSPPKTILGVGKLELKAVRFVDGNGEDHTRLAVKIGKTHHLFRETLGSANLLQAASDWLEEGIRDFTPPKEAPKGGGVKSTKAK